MKSLAQYLQNQSLGFCPGAFGALELLRHRPSVARELWLHPAASGEGIDKLTQQAQSLGTPIEQRGPWIERISKKGNCHALAVFERYPAAPQPGAHLLLHELQDAGNLGTLVRTALALGFGTVAVVGNLDAFSPAAVRAGMGAIFALEVPAYDSFEAYRAAFPDQKIYPLMTDGATELTQTAFTNPATTLVLGTEASGLPPRAAGWGSTIAIRQSSHVDSLNVACAGAIAMQAVSTALGLLR